MFEEVDLGLLIVDPLTKFSEGVVLLLNDCSGVSKVVLESVNVSGKFISVRNMGLLLSLDVGECVGVVVDDGLMFSCS